MTEMKTVGTQSVLNDPNKSAFDKYRKVVTGDKGLGYFIAYELFTMVLGPMPGALGIVLRQIFYPYLFRGFGKGVAIGRNVAIRNPQRISLGRGVIIEENCTMDAKGNEGQGIIIDDHVFVGKGSILSTTDGTVEICEGANIGSNCRIGTVGHTKVGKKALLAAYCYLVGAGHEHDDLETPILDQPNTSEGGVTIGDGCWLGARTTVMDGISIGNDAMIGAHSLVTKHVEAFAIAVGTPAKTIRSRKDGHASA